jgi:c-di-GMP-binding flagellar brake protein YcgR
MAEANLEILKAAIARNAGLVLSLPSAGMLRHHKSRFLCESPPGSEGSATGGFWVESAPGEAILIDSLIASKQSAGLSFKNGQLKVVFGTPILSRKSGYRINATTEVEALLLDFPQEVKAIQRRNNYRVGIPGGAEISVRVWRIGSHTYLGDRPAAAQEVECELRDLSISGMGVIFRGKAEEPAKVSTEDRLRIELSHSGNKMLIEGRMRHPTKPPKDPQFRAGIQFKALENDLDGRQLLAQLTRIVGELQRDEVRRIRLGLCKAS